MRWRLVPAHWFNLFAGGFFCSGRFSDRFGKIDFLTVGAVRRGRSGALLGVKTAHGGRLWAVLTPLGPFLGNFDHPRRFSDRFGKIDFLTQSTPHDPRRPPEPPYGLKRPLAWGCPGPGDGPQEGSGGAGDLDSTIWTPQGHRGRPQTPLMSSQRGSS